MAPDSGLRTLAAAAIAAAVLAFWFAIHRALPEYPPTVGVPLAFAASLFLIALTLLHRLHAKSWPGLARFGFVVSAIGLGLWAVGGVLRGLVPQATAASVWWRLTLELISRPQPGWGLFCVGLRPIGFAAKRSPLSRPLRLLLPLGGLLIVGEPLKYVLGERTGGLTVLVAFGAGWLAVGALLLLESRRSR